MALNLIEMLKIAVNAGRKYEAAILADMLRQNNILKIIPVVNVDAVKLTSTRWQTLPSVSTRKIGGTYTASEGTTEEVESTLAIYGGEILVDRVLTKIKAKENPLTLQSKMKVTAMMSAFNYDFINGDAAVYPDGMEGLAKMVSNQPARMTIDLSSGSAGLPVLKDATNRNLFIDALHAALHYVDNGGGDIAILCNEGAYLGVGKTLRQSGLLSTTQDAYDRTWEAFMGAKLVDIGLKGDQSTEIITTAENPTGGSTADTTSLYVARMDASDGLHLCQLNGTSPEPYDPLNGAEGGAGAVPAFMRRLEWVIGLRQMGKYSVARIKGVKFTTA